MFHFLNLIQSSSYGIIATIFMSLIGFIGYLRWGLRGSLELYESQRIYDRLFKKNYEYNLNITGITIHFINGWLLSFPFLLLIFRLYS